MQQVTSQIFCPVSNNSFFEKLIFFGILKSKINQHLTLHIFSHLLSFSETDYGEIVENTVDWINVKRNENVIYNTDLRKTVIETVALAVPCRFITTQVQFPPIDLDNDELNESTGPRATT